MSPKISEAEKAAFEHRARQFYIACAKHVLPLANLPEFQDIIEQLEFYDNDPTREDRGVLKKMYRKLWSKKVRRDYGDTSIGSFYRGLCAVLRLVLYETHHVSSSFMYEFAEAYDRAFEFIDPKAYPN